MKAIRILRRSIRDSFKSIFRNFSLSMASIICTTITLILVAISLFLSYNVRQITTTLEHELTVVAYFKRDVTEEQKIRIENDLKNVAEKLRTYDFIENAEYGEGMVENIIGIFDVISAGTIAIVIALVVVTMFLIGNTIKLTIFSRKTQIEIKRLVGASNVAIKLPFVFEGFFLGIFGSIVPVLLSIYGYTILYNTTGGYLSTKIITLVEPFPFVFIVSGFLVIVGSVVGMIGSWLSVRKHLKI